MIVKLLVATLLVSTALSTTIVNQRQFLKTSKKELASTTPIKFIYIDTPTAWIGDTALPPALGIPGFATPAHPYNYVCYTFWTYPNTPVDAALIWSNISAKMTKNLYGTTDA